MKENRMNFVDIVGEKKAKERKASKNSKAQAKAKADKKFKKHNLMSLYYNDRY